MKENKNSVIHKRKFVCSEYILYAAFMKSFSFQYTEQRMLGSTNTNEQNNNQRSLKLNNYHLCIQIRYMP